MGLNLSSLLGAYDRVDPNSFNNALTAQGRVLAQRQQLKQDRFAQDTFEKQVADSATSDDALRAALQSSVSAGADGKPTVDYDGAEAKLAQAGEHGALSKLQVFRTAQQKADVANSLAALQMAKTGNTNMKTGVQGLDAGADASAAQGDALSAMVPGAAGVIAAARQSPQTANTAAVPATAVATNTSKEGISDAAVQGRYAVAAMQQEGANQRAYAQQASNERIAQLRADAATRTTATRAVGSTGPAAGTQKLTATDKKAIDKDTERHQQLLNTAGQLDNAISIFSQFPELTSVGRNKWEVLKAKAALLASPDNARAQQLVAASEAITLVESTTALSIAQKLKPVTGPDLEYARTIMSLRGQGYRGMLAKTAALSANAAIEAKVLERRGEWISNHGIGGKDTQGHSWGEIEAAMYRRGFEALRASTTKILGSSAAPNAAKPVASRGSKYGY